MKSTRRVMSSAAIVAIIAFVCLLALPSLAVARTIKGHIVDVVAENIGNITVTVRTEDRKSTRLNSSHSQISYAVFCLKKKNGYPGGDLVLLPTKMLGVRVRQPRYCQ